MSETFVLIPGSWHGGWVWRPVARRLRTAGHRAVPLTLPGMSDGDDPRAVHLADAVDYVVSRVTELGLRDVTLVAHSWGGFPLTGAAFAMPERVSRLVYWSAFVPDGGHSLLDEIPVPHAEMFQQLAEASGDDSISLPFEIWSRNFIQDASDDVKRLVHGLLVPQPMSYFAEGLDLPPVTSLGIPASYLYSRDDLSLPRGKRGWVPRFPDRLGVPVIEVPGSHESSVTRPVALAEALLRSAEHARSLASA
jgi:pimeloyl-ACP methyl ester carboxylesterase